MDEKFLAERGTDTSYWKIRENFQEKYDWIQTSKIVVRMSDPERKRTSPKDLRQIRYLEKQRW